MEPEAKDNESETDIVIEEIVDEETSENNDNENEERVTECVDDNLENVTQEVIEKQKMEKVFKKQEEEWLDRKEKVSTEQSFLFLPF